MTDRDKVISRLQIIRTWAEVGKNYNGIQGEGCLRDVVDWIDDALELLKEQEPRVLSREEIEKWNQLDLWMENKDGEPDLCGDYLMPMTRMSYALWNAIIVDNTKKKPITNGYYYGKTWRCWSARPTDEQRGAVPWND